MIRRLSTGRGFVDRPGGHKSHSTPVALGGGVAVTCAATLPILAGGIAAWWLASARPAWLPADIAIQLGGILSKMPAAMAVVGGAWVLCILGLIDDARTVRPLT